MKKIIILILLSCSQFGCKKYLDEKPNKALALPKDNLENLQLLIDDTGTMNQASPSAGEVSSDNFLLSDAQLNAVKQTQPTSGNLYIWNRDLFNDKDQNEWTYAYKAILNTNIVLDALSNIDRNSSNQKQWDLIKGEALFFRAFYFYQLLQGFAKQYDANTALNDPGIVLKLKSDINNKSIRASVQQCYDEVVSELLSAINLLEVTANFKSRPNLCAAYGLLAKTFLVMGDYKSALEFANKYLKISPDLIDYNTLSQTAAFPIARYNIEVNFYVILINLTAYGTTYGRVDNSLYNSYDQNDLRKVIFFKNGGVNNVTFKGSYDGSHNNFGGIATDEIYLIASESNARLGNITDAMSVLNQLILKRWKKGTFVPFGANDQRTALQTILLERRKELVYRNIRWSDLRRLNKDSNYQTIITRVVNGQIYTLNPGDLPYTLSLPIKVVQLSGIQQN